MVLDQSSKTDTANRATGIAVVTWTGAGLLATVLFCSGCFTTTAGHIERVLAQDAQAAVGAKSVGDIVVRMRAIDTGRCPADFRSAYLTHVHAWEEVAFVEQQALAYTQQNSTSAVMVESFIRGALGDPFGKTTELLAGHSQLQNAYATAMQSVQRSWHRVEEIAVLHGAKLPKPRN